MKKIYIFIYGSLNDAVSISDYISTTLNAGGGGGGHSGETLSGQEVRSCGIPPFTPPSPRY